MAGGAGVEGAELSEGSPTGAPALESAPALGGVGAALDPGACAKVKFSTRMRASSVHLPSGYCFKKAWYASGVSASRAF